MLIYPPIENLILANVPQVVEEEQGCYPPLGLMYIAAYAEQNTDHEIGILDTQVEKIGYGQLEEEIKRKKPEVVGMTAITFSIIDTFLTAKIVKKVDSDIKVVLGGPHVTIYPEETIKIQEVDFIVLGEGEIIFTELIQHLENGKKLREIKGLVFRDGEEIVNTGRRDFIKDLDGLPFPARRLTPYKKYYSLLSKRSPMTSMMTSRGCSYQCLFCDRPHLGKLFRARSPENVVEEMEDCIDLGIKEIMFYEDTFNVDKKRVVDICDLILERGVDIAWDIRARVDNIDREFLRKLRKAGCERIHFGVESGTPEMLRVLRKGITLEQAENAFKWSKEAEISTLAYFMIGSPGETREQIEETIRFAKKLDPDFVHFSVTVPFPATDLYKLGLEKGMWKRDYWREFARNPQKDFQPELWEEELSRDDLITLLDYAYKTFYLRPSYIFKRALKMRSISELVRNIKAGQKLLLS